MDFIIGQEIEDKQHKYEKGQGYELEYKNGKLINVFLYPQYNGQLPYNLNFNMKNNQILEYLGEPSTKNGGLLNISLAYDHLGIEFTFKTKRWDEQNIDIDFICLFQPDLSKTLCAICKQQSFERCARCKLVYYCGKNCQRQHWQFHKNYCNKN